MNSRLKININLKQDFFKFIFVFWFTTEIYFNTTVSHILGIKTAVLNNLVSITVFSLLIIQILFFQKYSYKQFAIILLITILFSVSVFLSGNRVILSAWMFIVASKNINFDEIVILARRILVIMLPIIAILCFAGYLDDITMYRGNVLRHSLGFLHPNQIGQRIFQLVLCNIYIHRNMIRIVDLIIIILAMLFCYFIPNSQTAVVCLAILLLFILIYYIVDITLKKNARIFTLLLIIISIFCNTFSVLMSTINLAYHPILRTIDNILSNRFSVCYIDLQLFGISWLGNKVYISAEERALAGIRQQLWLDNSYMNLLIRYGIITYIAFSLYYIFTMCYHRKKGNDMIVIILSLFAIYGMMEIELYSIQYNIFLLALSYPLYSNELSLVYTNKKPYIRIRL